MNTTRLPVSYLPIRKIDFQQDVKLAVLANVGALILMILAGCLFSPLWTIFSSTYALLCNLLIASFGSIVYLFLRVWISGLFMKKFSGVKPKYSFNVLYAYSKCDAFFDKKSYLIIILSSTVLLGIALSVICCFVPPWLFWGVYLIQATNIASASCDLYSTFVICRMPKELLVYDFGTSMFLYLPKDKIAMNL